MLSLAKKNLLKFLLMKRRQLHNQKNIKAFEVISTSFNVKDPYPNNPLIISSDAIIKPILAGIDSNKDNYND